MVDARSSDALVADVHQWLAVFEVVASRSHDAVSVSAHVPGDPNQRLLFVNESYVELTGYARDDVIGEPAQMLIGPETDLVELRGITDALDVSDRVSKELTFHRRDGSPFRVEAEYSRIDGPDGTRWLVSSYHDLSRRVAAQEAVWRTEAWAQALLSKVSDLVLVVDRETTIEWVSPSVWARLGYRPSDLAGTRAYEVIHPDDHAYAIREFEAIIGDCHDFTPKVMRVRHRSGEWLSFAITSSNQLDNPAIRGVILTGTDVTNRRLVEDVLMEQAALLEAIARGAPLEVTLQKITQMVEHVLPGTSCALGILDRDGVVRVRAAPSLPRPIVTLLDDLAADSDAGQELRHPDGEAYSHDLRSDNALGPVDAFALHGYQLCRQARVVAPGSGELLGALNVFHRDADKLTPLGADLLDRALNLAAIAVERRRFEAALEHQALYDPLTGLPNRTLLQSRIDDAQDRASRLDSGVAVLFVDLDRFKVINDSVGHALGDQVLIEVTERFQESLRPGDTLGRFGGDEFMIVCGRVADEAAAMQAAMRFMEQLALPITIDDQEIFVTASVGIAFDPTGARSAESLIRDADVAMYRAKDQGRNQFVVFQETLDLKAVEQLALEQAIRHAIDNEEFELYFQPVVRLTDGAMTHVEALVRWHRPGKGLVFPGVFIPLAEETGLIVPMGWWILEEACRRAASWPELPDGSQVEVAVNLSAKQLASADLLPIVGQVLERTGLDPSRLCFEVTESALVQDVAQAKEALLAIKSLGVHLAIDDFGTGYASLDYVRHFSMADYLKIDRSFVEGVEREGSQEAAIVTAAIALARSLGLTVIAEGVETLFQMEALRELECDLAQGYLFSRPVPVDAAIELLAMQ